MKIFLVGFMGSGKTTIGKHLSGQIGFGFVDTDRFIEKQQGMTVPEIFAQHGEVAFRDMERNVLQEIQKLDYTVVATGGGMPCYNDNMDLMRSSGKVVYLKTSPKTLSRRLLRSYKVRPLIKGKTEKELQLYIIEKLNEREHFYNRAHFVVPTENFSMEGLLRLLGFGV